MAKAIIGTPSDRRARQRSTGALRALCLGLGSVGLIAGATGCLEFRRGESKTVDKVVDTREDLVRSPAADNANLDLAGTVLTVAAEPHCDLVDMEKVEHTTAYERKFEDDAEVPIAVLEAMSLVPMIAGVALLADSPKVFSSDPNQREYNPTGHTTAVNAGAALLSVGALVNIWPTVELIRSAVSEKDTSTSERQGSVVQRNVDCANRYTASGHYVTLRHTGGTISLGSTDANGKLTTDLKQVLPLSVFQTPNPPVSMGVWLDSQYVGDIGVAKIGMALLAQREEQDDLAWRASEPQGCASARNEPACAQVRQYLQNFPRGRHAAEATALIQALTVQQAPPPNGGPKIATDGTPPPPLLDRAVSESQAAAQQAIDAVWKKLETDTKKAEQQAEKEAAQAGKTACVKTCRQVCAADATCRKSCEEQCP